MIDHSIHIRPLAARDSIEALTRLLHRAYAPLADAGMNFNAATQTPRETASRAAEGQCFVAERQGALVGTVTVAGPYNEVSAPWTASAPWFRDPDTAHFHQFAVDPGLQGRGLGRGLVARCEQWALERGFRRMLLDTAEQADELRGLYRRLGYRDIGRVRWDGRAYDSVVMCKTLVREPMREHLALLARYNEWATQRLFDAVDALPEADYRRPAGLFFGSIHGTLNHLLVGEHELWFQRFANEQSPTLALDAEVEPDRARLRQRLIKGAANWGPLIAAWPSARFDGVLHYRRADGEALTLPFAATLAHVFNHGTHHRGQISAALTALGRPAPELDMVRMLQEEST